MAAIEWPDVTAWASEMASVAEAAQDLILAYANGLPYAANLDGEEGDRTKLARVLMACHLASTGPKSGGAAGPVTSESEGGLSRSYGMLASSTGLGRSSYGQELKALLRRHVGGPRVT